MKRNLIAAICAVMAMGTLCSCAEKNEMTVDEVKEPIVLDFFLPMSIKQNEGANVFLELIDQYNASHGDV